ncbi:Uncharacterised protein [Mycobacteroides abscessus subsp. abscessus]|nr:Uncharacterised protein [Mycobacteroides abscessus subsp. abscessus]
MTAPQIAAGIGKACNFSGIKVVIFRYSSHPSGQPIGAASAQVPSTHQSEEGLRNHQGGVTLSS